MHETLRVGSSFLAVSLFTSLFALASCGGNEGSNPPPTTPASPSAKSTDATTPPAADSGSPPTSSGGPATPATPATPSAADGPWPFGPAPSADERTAQLERLKKDPGPIKSNWTPPGKSDRYGHAEGVINAPPDTVRAKLSDFAHYKDLAGPKFKSVKVVEKQGDKTDVYFQLPIMKGLVTIWYITRFPPMQNAKAGDVVEGTYVKGNIKNMHIAFTVRPGADEKQSVMVCDLVLQPNVPAPQSALDEELRDACGDAINSLRAVVAKP